MDDSETPAIPEPVTRMWDSVKKALTANGNPSPRHIDRMAASLGLELAASTTAGWFETWSVVPVWEKFDVLIKALGAEHDEDWRSLHGVALTADRERKKEERRRKGLGRKANSTPSGSSAANRQTNSQPLVHDLPADAAVSVDRPQESSVLAPADLILPITNDGTPTKVNLWRTLWAVGAVIGITVLIAVLLSVWSSDRSGRVSSPEFGSGASTPSSASPGLPIQPAVRYCAFVIKEPAAVYPTPDNQTKEIKFKKLGDRVEILDRPHSPGWLVVRTPNDRPGFNWMRADVLTATESCKPPLPG